MVNNPSTDCFCVLSPCLGMDWGGDRTYGDGIARWALKTSGEKDKRPTLNIVYFTDESGASGGNILSISTPVSSLMISSAICSKGL